VASKVTKPATFTTDYLQLSLVRIGKSESEREVGLVKGLFLSLTLPPWFSVRVHIQVIRSNTDAIL